MSKPINFGIMLQGAGGHLVGVFLDGIHLADGLLHLLFGLAHRALLSGLALAVLLLRRALHSLRHLLGGVGHLLGAGL